MTWRIRLGRRAEDDLQSIMIWTLDRFGLAQARRYRGLVLDAIGELHAEPMTVASRAVPEIAADARILHIGRGRRGRHFLLYRIEGADQIVIARILHVAMDLDQHLPQDADWL